MRRARNHSKNESEDYHPLLLSRSYFLDSKRGIGLIEIVVGVGVISISLIGIASAFTLYFRAINTNTEAIRTAYVLEEGVEALVYLRNAGWNDNIEPIATSTTYYFVFENSTWKSTTTPIIIEDVLVRSFFMTDVWRKVADDDTTASTSPETKYFDPDIRHVKMTVTNTSTGKETVIETYLVNLFRN